MAFASEAHRCIHCQEVGTNRVNDAQYRKAGYYRRILWCAACGERTEHITSNVGVVTERYYKPQKRRICAESA